MKRIFFIVSLILLVCTASLPLSAKVRLPRLVSNKMVLQRDTELKIWGWASPGEKVIVRFVESIIILKLMRRGIGWSSCHRSNQEALFFWK